MNDIRFIHSRNKEYYNTEGTLAISLPDKAFLENTFEKHATAIILYLGTAKLHPNEQFNKKMGRTVSEGKIKLQVCYLDHVEIRSTKHIYHFVSHVPNNAVNGNKFQEVCFGLSTVAESEKVQVVYGFFGQTTNEENPHFARLASSTAQPVSDESKSV